MLHRLRLPALIAVATATIACEQPAKPDKNAAGEPAPQTGQAVKPQQPLFNTIKREDFNRLAAELSVPLFWTEDRNNDGALTEDELATWWGLRPAAQPFADVYRSMERTLKEGPKLEGLDEGEVKRRRAVLKELSQGRLTLVQSDFRGAPAEDLAVVKGVLAAAELIETIFAKQKGVKASWTSEIAADDTASRTLMYRNQGPWCVAPDTENDPDCNAVPSKPKKISGLYPENIQVDDPKFCDKLAARKDADQLFHQFSVVVDEGGALKAVPYNVAYKAEMSKISAILRETAAAITSAEEAAFKAYLTAAAQAFEDNNWFAADEAWAKMNAQNSKWYLRIGPDETYFEPCARKAGFHVSFARINKASVEWQTKLEPVKNEMEAALAALAGPPYKARQVSFHLPDFIDIIVNAGDSRDEHGATIGQSLPNWGPVANEGRGRTVAMTSFYTDPDSVKSLRSQVSSLFCEAAMPLFTDDYSPQLMSTILHEAAHNLGPAHEYKANGKTDDQAFGGPLAAMLEELKAQSSAGFFADWLVEKGLITRDVAERAHTRDVVWSFGHISRGMYSDNKPRPYSQLAAIIVGSLIQDGAMTWHAEELAANKQDKGCFTFELPKFPAAMKSVTGAVAKIKGRGDKAKAIALQKTFVDAPKAKELHAVIRERWLRSPRATFVYAIQPAITAGATASDSPSKAQE
jgi:hypothetical protein